MNPVFAALRTSSRYRAIARFLRELREDEMPGERQRVCASKSVAAIQIACGKRDDLGGISEPRLSDKSHSRQIRELIEVESVDLRQFIGELHAETVRARRSSSACA